MLRLNGHLVFNLLVISTIGIVADYISIETGSFWLSVYNFTIKIWLHWHSEKQKIFLFSSLPLKEMDGMRMSFTIFNNLELQSELWRKIPKSFIVFCYASYTVFVLLPTVVGLRMVFENKKSVRSHQNSKYVLSSKEFCLDVWLTFQWLQI